MDFRELLGKLDTLNEAISLKTVNAAVAGKNNEQDRARILQQMAEKNGLPGLYDPVTGYFVSAMPDTSNWPEQRPRISATASKDDDKKLAAAGLIPSNANTSTWLGKAFGASGDQYDQDLRQQSSKAAAAATDAELQAKIPKLVAKGKALLLKIVTAYKQEQEAKTATAAAPASLHALAVIEANDGGFFHLALLTRLALITHSLVLALLQPFHLEPLGLGLAVALFRQAHGLLRNGLALAHLLLQGFNARNEIAIHRVVAHGMRLGLGLLEAIAVFITHHFQALAIGTKLRQLAP